MKKPSSLGPELYDKDYYLHSLPGIEYLEKQDVCDPTITETIKFGRIKAGQYVLDFGCGRGTLAIALVQKGCTTLGVDFSQNAIDFAKDYLKRFPEEIQKRVKFEKMDMAELSTKEEFDVIVFNQVYEHLHNWELEILIPKFRQALKSNGILVISTPNLNYIRYLYPLKRILELPFKIMKETLRVLRGRSKHASSFSAFSKEIFKIRYPESEHTRLHINLQTPHSVRTFMEQKGFHVELECVDYHKNVVSLAFRKRWGETIWLSCNP